MSSADILNSLQIVKLMNNLPILLGAIAGDTIGSIYEFDPVKNYDFTLLDEQMEYTDDSILTLAVAEWLMDDPTHSPIILQERLRYWGNKYRNPKGSYGNRFYKWLLDSNPQPYQSWGNGSAMRVSAVGFACETLDEVLNVAKLSAEITHNHPEGIKGAQAVAAAIFMAQNGKTKEEIRQYISNTFHYDLNFTCKDIHEDYGFEDSYQKTVPQSIVAFLDSKNFEDAIRLTISLGGDADTMGAITGSIALAYYHEMPKEIRDFVMAKLPGDLMEVLKRFDNFISDKK